MIDKIAPDKWKHLFVGIAMGVLFELIGRWLLAGHFYWVSGIALAIIIAISYGWELLSKITGKGHYEIMDAVFSIFGGIMGISLGALAWI